MQRSSKINRRNSISAFMTDALRERTMGEAAVKAAIYKIRRCGTVEFW
jgi:hypothetical protein